MANNNSSSSSNQARNRSKKPVTKHLFKDAPFILFEGDSYQRQPSPSYCGVCGKKTHYKSDLAREHICSEECSREMWYEIFTNLQADRRRVRK